MSALLQLHQRARVNVPVFSEVDRPGRCWASQAGRSAGGREAETS